MEPSPQGCTCKLRSSSIYGGWDTHGFTSGNLQDLGGESDGSLDAKVLVVCSVYEIGRDYKGMRLGIVLKGTNRRARTFFETPDSCTGQGNPNFVDLGWWNRGASGIVFLISLSDVTHYDRVRR